MDQIREKIPLAIIDEGTFKYILINIQLKGDPSDVYTIVRGFHGLNFHQANFDKFT